MEAIYNDSTFFDTVRGVQRPNILLLNNIVPEDYFRNLETPSSASTSVIMPEVPCARCLLFRSYKNIDTSASLIHSQDSEYAVYVPLRSFSYSLEARSNADKELLDNGYQGYPYIHIKGDFSAGAQITFITKLTETAPFNYIDYSTDGIEVTNMREGTDITERCTFSYGPRNFVTVTLPTVRTGVKFTFKKSTVANATLEIMGIFLGSTEAPFSLAVNRDDISAFSAKEKHDLTGAALPSASLSLDLVNENLQYKGFTFNTVYVAHIYQGDNDRYYYSEPHIYFLTKEPKETVSATDFTHTIIDAVDIMSVINGDDANIADNGSYGYKYYDEYALAALQKARGIMQNSVIVSAGIGVTNTASGEMPIDQNTLVPYFNRVSNSPAAVVVQKATMFKPYGTEISGDFVAVGSGIEDGFGIRVIDPDGAIMQSEMFDVPQPTIYPKLKTLILTLRQRNEASRVVTYSDFSVSIDNENEGQALQVSNDLISDVVFDRQDVDQHVSQITAFAEEFILPSYSYIMAYELDVRGRFDLKPLDEVKVELQPGVLTDCVVTEHELTYNGAYRSKLVVFADPNAAVEIINE